MEVADTQGEAVQEATQDQTAAAVEAVDQEAVTEVEAGTTEEDPEDHHRHHHHSLEHMIQTRCSRISLYGTVTYGGSTLAPNAYGGEVRIRARFARTNEK
jgi:phosphoribosylformylglycinamidine (FGAM) synthase PurS component